MKYKIWFDANVTKEASWFLKLEITKKNQKYPQPEYCQVPVCYLFLILSRVLLSEELFKWWAIFFFFKWHFQVTSFFFATKTISEHHAGFLEFQPASELSSRGWVNTKKVSNMWWTSSWKVTQPHTNQVRRNLTWLILREILYSTSPSHWLEPNFVFLWIDDGSVFF